MKKVIQNWMKVGFNVIKVNVMWGNVLVLNNLSLQS